MVFPSLAKLEIPYWLGIGEQDTSRYLVDEHYDFSPLVSELEEAFVKVRGEESSDEDWAIVATPQDDFQEEISKVSQNDVEEECDRGAVGWQEASWEYARSLGETGERIARMMKEWWESQWQEAEEGAVRGDPEGEMPKVRMTDSLDFDAPIDLSRYVVIREPIGR